MLNCCKNVALLFVLLLSSNSFASSVLKCRDTALDLVKMQAEIESLSLPQNQILVDYEHGGNKELEITKEPLPSEAVNVFHRMQDRVFGKSLFRVESSNDINFSAVDFRHSVLVNPKLWNIIAESNKQRDGRNTLRFIMAHELGHHVQDMIARKNKSKVSVNNHMLVNAVGRDESEIYVKNYLRKLGIKNPKQTLIDNTWYQLYGESHIEVDTYGYLILKMAGDKTPYPADLFSTFDIMMDMELKKQKISEFPKKTQDEKFLEECSSTKRRENLETFYFRDVVFAPYKFSIENKKKAIDSF